MCPVWRPTPGRRRLATFAGPPGLPRVVVNRKSDWPPGTPASGHTRAAAGLTRVEEQMLGFVQSWFAPGANPIGVDFGSDGLRMAQVEPLNGAPAASKVASGN